MIFKLINDKSIIDVILKVAGYNLWPIAWFVLFYILQKRMLPQNAVMVIICIAARNALIILSPNATKWF